MNDNHLPVRLIGQLRAPGAPVSSRRTLRRASRLLSLEQRFMFDGAAAASADHAAHAKPDAHDAAQAAQAAQAAAPVHQVREADAARNNGKKEIVFVDTSVAAYRTLEAGVRDGVAIVEFDGNKDGLAQIAAWARTHSGYDAIHILSHGSEGTLNLGTGVFNDASLSSSAVQAELADIGHALNAGGDLLLYGCDVAAGADGQRFVDDLARITGADVAASTNETGAADKGGDWSLEVHAGKIDTDALRIDGYKDLLTVEIFGPDDPDLQWDQTSIVRNIDGENFTFSGGGGAGGLGAYDASQTGDGSSGIYAYEGNINGVDKMKLTVTVQNGYMFDLSSFQAVASTGTLTFEFTYADGSTHTFSQSGVDTWQTLSAFGMSLDHVTQVVLSADDYALFQNFDINNVRAIPPVPVVSDSHVSITSTGSGTGGTYKIGDTVTAVWDNTSAGDNNAEINGVTMDFSQFGGPSSVTATESGGIWTATYTIAAGSVDATNRNITVKAVNYGGSATVADTTNLAIDNVAPTVTDANINISGGSGPGGTYKIGDTVTVTWNNTAGGDNNSDTLSSVTMDFSAFGGGSAIAATNTGGIWTATYVIAGGSVDASNLNVSVTVRDNAGNVKTTADTSNATVDNVAPTVTDGNISISGGTGTGGAYKVGDTVTAVWDNTAGGDNNTDTLSAVTFDFSPFGGGSTVTATNIGGVWTATYTIVDGSLDGVANRNVLVKVVDNGGNITTVADTTNATVDNVKPAAALSGVALSDDTGSSNSDFITNTASQTISATLSAPLAAGDIVYGSLDNGAHWVDITSKVSGLLLTWDGATLAGSSTLQLKVTDAAGNLSAVASQSYTVDAVAPATPSTPDMTSGTDSGASSSDNITQDTTPTFTGTAETGSTVTLYDSDGTTVLGTTTAVGGAWSITSSSLSEGGHTITAKAVDAAGNVSAASSALAVTIDTVGPTGLALSATTVTSVSATSGSSIATFLSNDATDVTYSMITGNGVIDADNGKFIIVGDALTVGGSSLSARTYHIYVSATDAAGNQSFQVFSIDVVDAPSVTSIVRTGGASATVGTSATSVTYTVTFSESVTGIDTGDFILTPSGSASGFIAGISGSGATYTVTVSGVSGDGTLRLDLKNSGTGIQNGSSVGIVGGYTSGDTYTLDHTPPSPPSTPVMTSGTDSGVSSSDGITQDTTPTFTGTAEPGSIVTLYDTDGITVLGTTTVGVGAVWSITTSALSEGSHTITAKATDAAGNVSSASSGLDVTIDVTAPNVSISSSAATLKAGETAIITFTFSEDPGTSFSLGDITVSGGTLSGFAGSGLTRTAIFTPTAGLNSFAGNISVSAGTYTDVAGNNGGSVSLPTLTGDTLAPNAPSTPDMTSGSDSGSSSSDDITQDTTPTFTGTAEAGSTVTLYDTDGTTVLGTVVATGGNWSITTTTLGEGTHTITAKATDAAGNVSNASSAVTVSIDATAPAATVASASLSSDTGTSAGDFITRTAAQTISGTLSATLGSDESVEVSLDNGNTWHTATASTGGSTWSYATTLSGSDTLKVRVVDAAGNVSPVFSQAYALDSSAPLVNAVSVPSNGTYYTNQDLDFTVHFTEAVTVDTTGGTPRIALVIGSTTVYAIYQSGSGTSDLVFRYVVANGNQDANGITLGALSADGGTLRDTAGNDAALTLNNVGSTAAVNVDGSSPRITDVAATVPDGVYKIGDTVTITLTFDKAVTVDTSGGTPTLTLNNGGIASYASGSGGTTLVFTYTIAAGQDVADLDYSTIGALLLNGGAVQDAAGAHQNADLGLSAPGAAGSLGANKDIAIDATAPSVTLGGVTLSNDTGASDSDLITSVAAQTIGATLSAPLDSGDKVYGSLDNGGTWIDITGKVSGTVLSWDGATLVGGGTIKLRVVDAAGNVGATSTQAYVLDVAPPEAPTVAPVQSPGSTPVLSGTATLEPGETLTVTVDGATYQVVPSDGQWSLDLASARPVSGSVTLSPGSSYSVTATVTDVAGNTSSATGVLSVAAPSSQTEPPPPQSDPAPPPSAAILPPPPPVHVVPLVTDPSYRDSSTADTPLFDPTPVLGPEVRFLPSELETSLRFSAVAGNMGLSGLSPLSTSGIASFMGSALDSRAGPEILTHGSSFGVVVVQASAESQGLMLNRGMEDQVVPLSDHMEISIPSDVFAHTDPNAVIELAALQADGRPLPNWVRFDAGSGKFTVDAPKGMTGQISVKVVARDGNGREAATVFHIRVGGKQAQAQPQHEGRAALSEQLHQAARQRAGAGLLARFAEVADALRRPNT